MQTETQKPLSPSYRAIGRGPSGTIFAASNIAEAIKTLSDEGFAAYETADGLLTLAESHISSDRAAPVCEAEDDLLVEWPYVFPIVAGQVDMGAVARFIGN